MIRELDKKEIVQNKVVFNNFLFDSINESFNQFFKGLLELLKK